MDFWVVVGLSLLIAGAGLLVPWISRRAASGRLARNHLAGVRTSSTLASDEAWVAGHRASLPYADAAGVCGVLTGVITPFFAHAAWPVVLLVGTTLLLIATLMGAKKAHDAAKVVATS